MTGAAHNSDCNVVCRDFCYRQQKRCSTLQAGICCDVVLAAVSLRDFASSAEIKAQFHDTGSQRRHGSRGLCTSGFLILIQTIMLFGSCFRFCGHKPSIMCCCGLKVSLDFMNHGEIVEAPIFVGSRLQARRTELAPERFFGESISILLVVNCRITRQNDGWQSKCRQDDRNITVSSNVRLTICSKENDTDSNRRTAMQKRWCSI